MTSALYTILGVRHLLSKGHLFLSLQLHPYLVLSEYKIFLLWEDIIEPMFGKVVIEFYSICIKYGIHRVRGWKMFFKAI